MTSTEIFTSLDRQLRRIHASAHKVMEARQRIAECESRARKEAGNADASGLTALGLAALALILLLVDASVVAPALADRFQTFGLPVELAWAVSVGCSVLLMFTEMVLAVWIFRAYERSLTSRRYFALAWWLLMALVVVGVTVGLGISQIYIMTGLTLDDPARLSKEIALLLLFAGAHMLLISSGRYLEPAKEYVVAWFSHLLARMERDAARNKTRRAHNRLSDDYRIYRGSIYRARGQGHAVELGPFEDQTLALIRERHSRVDEDLAAMGAGQAPVKLQRVL